MWGRVDKDTQRGNENLELVADGLERGRIKTLVVDHRGSSTFHQSNGRFRPSVSRWIELRSSEYSIDLIHSTLVVSPNSNDTLIYIDQYKHS